MLSRRLVKDGHAKVWGNHDAILTQSARGEWFVGDAEPMAAKWTPLHKYAQRVENCECEVRVYEVIGANALLERRAVEWWDMNVCGTMYDFTAFPRLAFKSIFGEFLQTAAGLEWANWCTEGVANAYEYAFIGDSVSVWQKNNPTPLTTEKRVGLYPELPGAVTLNDITEYVALHPAHIGGRPGFLVRSSPLPYVLPA